MRQKGLTLPPAVPDGDSRGINTPRMDPYARFACVARGDGLQIKLGGDPIYRAQEGASPEGYGLLGAAIVLLIAAELPAAEAESDVNALAAQFARRSRDRLRRPAGGQSGR